MLLPERRRGPFLGGFGRPFRNRDEVYKSVAKESHPTLQPVNSLIAELKHFLSCHGGVRTEYLGLYAAWVAFKSSVRDGKIGERIGLLEPYCFQTQATFRVKDRYGRKKWATVL